MLILNSLKESVERPGVVGTRGLLAEVGYSRSAGRRRLLDLKKSVDASRRRGVVRIALSSPEWGGPKRENRREGDGTSKCYRWLAKDDLMTKTGYGYAKCLTVAGTATTVRYRCRYGRNTVLYGYGTIKYKCHITVIIYRGIGTDGPSPGLIFWRRAGRRRGCLRY